MTDQSEGGPQAFLFELEIEVIGAADDVWKAIATASGVADWFLPAEISDHVGGVVSFDSGYGIERRGCVTAWEPPLRFAYEDDCHPLMGGRSSRLTSMFVIDEGEGGRSLVRLVTTDRGPDRPGGEVVEALRDGWNMYFQNLRLYLAHYAGQRSSSIAVTGSARGSRDQGWTALTEGLGLLDATPGRHTAVLRQDLPPLAGIVQWIADSSHNRGLLFRLYEPTRGVGHVFVTAYQDLISTNVAMYLFGSDASVVAARDSPVWQAWMARTFPRIGEQAGLASEEPRLEDPEPR